MADRKFLTYALISAASIAIILGCQSAPPVAKETEAAARGFEEIGGFAKQDYLNLMAINERVEKERKISDADLDFALTLFEKPIREPGMGWFTVMEVLLNAKELTPSQSNKVLDVVGKIVAGPDPNGDPGNVRRLGALVLANTRDQRAKSIIQPLLSDTRPHVKRDAQKAMERLKAS